MAASLGELVVSLSANIAKFEEAMSKAEHKSQVTAQKIADSMQTAERAVVGLAAGFVSFKTVEAFVDGVQGAIQMAEELHKLSIQTGTSVEELSKLKGVAKLSGVEMSTVGVALQSLSKAMYETASGTGKARDTFYAMGLSVKDARGQLKPAADFMQEVAKKLESMANETQKVAAAQKIMRGVGAEVLPFLRDLAAAGELEAKVSETQAFQAHQYTIALVALKAAKLSMYNTVAQQVTPVLTALVRTFTELTNRAGGLNDSIKKLAAENTIRQWAVNGALAITFVIDKLLDTVKVFEFVVTVITTLGSVAWSVFKIIGSAITTASAVLNEFGIMADGVALILNGQFTLGAQIVSASWARMRTGVSDAFAGMKRELASAELVVSDLYTSFGELQKSVGQDTYTNAFLDNYGKVLSSLNLVKKGTEEVTIVKKHEKDATDQLSLSLAKEIAALQTNLDHMRRYGIETKATTVAEVALQLAEMERNGTLAEHARRTGESVAQTKERILAMAREKDGLIDGVKLEQEYIAAVKKANEAMAQSVQSIVDQIEKQKDENATIGMTADAVTLYAAAKLEARKADLLGTEGAELYIKALDLQIAKLKELAALQQSGEGTRNFVASVQEGAKWVGEIAKGFAQSVSKGIDVARDKLKQFLYDLIDIFARKWFLNVVASATGSSALGAAAGQVGQGTIAGAAANWVSGGATAYAGGSIFGAGALTGAGDFVGTGLAGMAGNIALAAGATDAFAASIAAAVPVIGWVIAIGAVLYSLFGHKGGGPKTQGAFAGVFGSDGSSSTLANGPSLVSITGDNQAQAAAQQIGTQIATSFFASVRSLGGDASKLQFTTGIGFSQDTQGTAPSFVHGLGQLNGQTIFQQNLDDVARGDAELQSAVQQMSGRVLLAALQHVDFAAPINAVLRSIDVESASLDDIQKILAQAQEVANVLHGIEALSAYGLTGLSLDSVKALQHEGESLTQTMNRLAQETIAMDSAFTSNAEKIQRAKNALDTFYQDLATSGFAAPTNKQEWLATFKALDLSTEAGRRLHDEMVALAPSFLAVADATAKLKSDFESIQTSIDKLLGRNTAQRQLTDAVSQFQSGNSWAQGLTAQQLIAALETITEQDFGNYSEENQRLIAAILQLAGTMTDASTSITQAASSFSTIDPAYSTPQETWVAALSEQFTKSYGELINSQPTYLQKFGLQQTLMTDQIAQWTQRAKDLEKQYAGYQLPPEYNALLTMIQNFANQVGGQYYAGYGQYQQGGTPTYTYDPLKGFTATYQGTLVADIQKLVELEAQFGEQKGQQIFDLDKWYEGMKTTIGTNADALAALEKLYADKRTAILTDSAQQGVDALEQIRQSILKFRDGLLTSNLSPLTTRQQFTYASDQYEKITALAKGGDADALRQYQSTAQTYLQQALQMFGRSSIEYQELFNLILTDSSILGGDTSFEAPTAADITGVRDTIQVENQLLRELVVQLIDGIKNQTAVTQEGQAALADAIVILGDNLNQAKEVTNV